MRNYLPTNDASHWVLRILLHDKALYPTYGHNIIIVHNIIGVNMVSCDNKHVYIIIMCSMYVSNEIRNAYIYYRSSSIFSVFYGAKVQDNLEELSTLLDVL